MCGKVGTYKPVFKLHARQCAGCFWALVSVHAEITAQLTLVESAFPGFHFLKSPSSLLYLTRGQVNPLYVFDLHAGLAESTPRLLDIVFTSQCSYSSIRPLPYITASPTSKI